MEVFNNRELATATLVVIFFMFACYKSEDVFPAIKLAFSTLVKKTMLIITVSLLLYTLLVVFVLHSIDVWNWGQLKNTIMWFVFIGFVQLFNTTSIRDMNVYVSRSLGAQVKVMVLVEFLVAFHSYSFMTELVLVTAASLLACCSVFAQNKPEYENGKKLCDLLLIALGIIVVLESIFNIYQDTDKFFTIETYRDFLVPVLLSVSLLPYTYCFYYFLSYERAYVKVHSYTNSKQLQRYAKMRSFIAFRGKLHLIRQWVRCSCISEFESKSTIAESIQRFLKINQKSTV
ncbi:hypothetical protein [Vibrio ouci]|uniref:Uncharacterized protein n=1 Tax=Vibrio ouci TaxID=2499078 RepID=A0A4Y8W8R1_9VIBR|nr:hypothetical protein [Vibrio ouci]TFH88945.1 hypothetical protein ELS82_25065 [Vibrio ouci]